MSDDGADMGIGVKRALETVVGGKESPKKEDGLSSEQMKEKLLNKDDDINGYDAHAEVMAKYIFLAMTSRDRLIRNLHEIPCERIYLWKGNDSTVVCPDLSDVLKEHIYIDKEHPFRKALSDASGFTWGWAVNAARYAAGLPPVRNPAIIEIG